MTGGEISKLFHAVSKNSPNALPIQKSAPEEKPEEWRVTEYKLYPRLPKIKLLRGKPAANLFDVIRRRKSQRNFSDAALSRKDLSLVLQYSCGETTAFDIGRKRRAYPSAGARFPIEIYPIVLRGGNDLQGGVYHYDPASHQLDIVWDHNFQSDEIERIFLLPNCRNASVLLALTAVFSRMQRKYGERGYRHVLLEAGHIGQNIYLVAGALRLKCVGVSGVRDRILEEIIDIDGVEESLVYALALGT